MAGYQLHAFDTSVCEPVADGVEHVVAIVIDQVSKVSLSCTLSSSYALMPRGCRELCTRLCPFHPAQRRANVLYCALPNVQDQRHNRRQAQWQAASRCLR